MTPVSPTGRLHQLAKAGRLTRLQAPNLDAAAELYLDAQAHARAVPTLLAVKDYSATVLLAYEMARKLALALLLAAGWRPAGGEGEHRITFDAAVLLLSGPAAKTLADAAYLRRQRNDNMYRHQRADPAAADEAADLAADLVRHVIPVLRDRVETVLPD